MFTLLTCWNSILDFIVIHFICCFLLFETWLLENFKPRCGSHYHASMGQGCWKLPLNPRLCVAESPAQVCNLTATVTPPTAAGPAGTLPLTLSPFEALRPSHHCLSASTLKHSQSVFWFRKSLYLTLPFLPAALISPFFHSQNIWASPHPFFLSLSPTSLIQYNLTSIPSPPWQTAPQRLSSCPQALSPPRAPTLSALHRTLLGPWTTQRGPRLPTGFKWTEHQPGS